MKNFLCVWFAWNLLGIMLLCSKIRYFSSALNSKLFVSSSCILEHVISVQRLNFIISSPTKLAIDILKYILEYVMSTFSNFYCIFLTKFFLFLLICSCLTNKVYPLTKLVKYLKNPTQFEGSCDNYIHIHERVQIWFHLLGLSTYQVKSLYIFYLSGSFVFSERPFY